MLKSSIDVASAVNRMEMIKLFDCKTNKQETGSPQTLTDAIRHHRSTCGASHSVQRAALSIFRPLFPLWKSILHNRDLTSGDGDELNYWKQMHHGLQLCSLSGIN